jgi:hypothetical protein
MEQAQHSKWIESILEHVAGTEGDMDDAAEWLCYFLGKKYDASFTLASETLGLLLVNRLDEASAQAMWSDANINVTQQRIIKKHLRHHFGKRVFIPDKSITNDGESYYIPTHYGEYHYYKRNDASQKPEKCSYWCRDASVIVTKELERLIDFNYETVESTNYISSLSEGCTIISGGDHGHGAWRSWVKISMMGKTEIQKEIASDPSFDTKKTYIASQVAHIACKKDHHSILTNTISPHMSTAYDKLVSSALVFTLNGHEKKVKSYYVSKYATDIKIENNKLTYIINSGPNNEGYLMRVSEEEDMPHGSKLLLIIPSFDLFITGDLSYYADVLGMPSSTSYWCPWCLLSRIQWQVSADATGEERTAEFQQNTYKAVLNDTTNRMTPAEKNGVVTEMHYASLTPQNFVPPLLHLEIGMVNQAWDDFEKWIDDVVEVIPQCEKDARKKLAEAFELRERAASEKKRADQEFNIEIREKNAELKILKAQLKRKEISLPEKNELQTWVTLLNSCIQEQKDILTELKKKSKEADESYSVAKIRLEKLKEERGKPDSSLITDIELLLTKFAVEREVYHGGNFNGVCCRRIVGNAAPIVKELRAMIKMKKGSSCDDTVIDKLDEFEHTLGLLDAAYAYLNVPFPSDDDKKRQPQLPLNYQSNGGRLGITLP